MPPDPQKAGLFVAMVKTEHDGSAVIEAVYSSRQHLTPKRRVLLNSLICEFATR
jgi:hypothetical protein